MLYTYIKLGFPIKDTMFDKIYPTAIQELSDILCPPIPVAVKAAKLLVKDESSKVLDIGSGVGKFCLLGAATTGARFTGIEQRSTYADISEKIVKRFKVPNVKILNKNIKEVDFTDFDSFYLFNPLHENTDPSMPHDEATESYLELYNEYCQYIKNQLTLLPIGTRIVTYLGSTDEIPEDYKIISTDFDSKLKLWTRY